MAPIIEYIYQEYLGQRVEVVTAGMDWNQPYSCQGWATSFGQTLPILDDNSGGNIYSLFGVGYVPHNIVINGAGQVIYSQSGFNQSAIITAIETGLSTLILDMDEDGVLDDVDNCIEEYNPNQEDYDLDGIGDYCDPCDNISFYVGNLNGDAFVDLFDILLLVDIVLGHANDGCSIESSDINSDGSINVLDVIFLLQQIIGGNQQRAINYLESIVTPSEFKQLTSQYSVLNEDKVIVFPNPSNNHISIFGNGYTTIYDIRGRLIKQIDIDGKYIWNTDKISAGIYYIINDTDAVKITILK